MTDIILSSFLSLFALFGKEEQVDEAWAKAMLENYLRHHFGIRNIDEYLDLYTKMRSVYEMFGDVDAKDTVRNICSNLHGKISSDMEAFLLLRLMEFCGSKKYNKSAIFVIMAEIFQIPKEQFQDFEDFRGLLPETLRRGSGSQGHPCRPGVRTLPGEVPRLGHDFLRPDAPERPCPGRETRAGLA